MVPLHTNLSLRNDSGLNRSSISVLGLLRVVPSPTELQIVSRRACYSLPCHPQHVYVVCCNLHMPLSMCAPANIVSCHAHSGVVSCA